MSLAKAASKWLQAMLKDVQNQDTNMSSKPGCALLVDWSQLHITQAF